MDDDAITGTSHTVDGFSCESAYQFRVSAYGSGTVYASAWSGAVGSVTATGSETYDPVTYAITSGDEAGRFAIGETTVEITVAGDLSAAVETTVTLTVEAEDDGAARPS